jgi:hypothetical protein
MTETNQHALRKLQLKADLALYSAGGVPSDEELERAPRLESWYVMQRTKKVEEMLDRYMSICAKVHTRANMADGEPCTTSAVVWFDRHQRFVRTVNTLYRLGTPIGNHVTGDDE